MIDWEGVVEDALSMLASLGLFLLFLFFAILMGAVLFKLIMGILH